MITDAKIKEQAQHTAILPRLEENLEFNWKHCWYPLTYSASDLRLRRILSIVADSQFFQTT